MIYDIEIDMTKNKIDNIVKAFRQADAEAKRARIRLEKLRADFIIASKKCESLELTAKELKNQFNELIAVTYGIE